MSSIVHVQREDVFPVGTTVSAYSGVVPVPSSGAPRGVVLESGTVDSAGVLEMTLTLDANAPVILYAVSPDRYLRITTITVPSSAQSGSLPEGGTTGQLLGKVSDEDGDADWVTLEGGGSGILVTNSGDDDPVSGDHPTGTQWIKGAF